MNILKKILRFLLAGLTALGILTGFCMFYFRWPVHLPNEKQNTDYIWQPGFRWMLMTEGISWGRIDDAGYNNLHVISDPDVLILGSSHMEAKNVPQTRNTAFFLQEKLGPEHRVYNMGISGHNLIKVCQYLPTTLALYETPPDYVIIETDSLAVTDEDVENIRNHTVDFTPSHTEGFIAALQKNPFLRHAVYKLQNGWLDLLLDSREKQMQSRVPSSPSQAPQKTENPHDQLFARLEQLQQQFHTKILVFYHPKEDLQGSPGVVLEIPPEYSVFRDSAQAHHILFLDLYEEFEHLIQAEHRLPHGFITGHAGVGHLNADGHRTIADALYEAIVSLEEENSLCR